MHLEVTNEGTLLILYVNGKPTKCQTMHTYSERAAFFLEAVDIVRRWFETENKSRSVPVTFESFVAKVTGKNLKIWATGNGSQPYPYAWPVKFN